MSRTLGKEVVLSGRLYERTNRPAGGETAQSYAVQQAAAVNRIQPGSQVSQSQISQANRAIVGTAIVGSTNQMPIQAISSE